MAKRPQGLPRREEIIAFLQERGGAVPRREIARAFGVKGADRALLRAELKALEAEGAVDRGHRRRVAAPGALPEVTVIDVVGLDEDGELIGRPASWREEKEPPRIYVVPERRGAAAPAPGMKLLARLKRLDAASFSATPIRVLTAAPERFLAEVVEADGRWLLRPADRRQRDAFAAVDLAGAGAGELVAAVVAPGRRSGLKQARVVERIGHADDPTSFSLIAIHAYGLPHVFPDDAVALAETAGEVGLEGRSDLRDLPLVTIDGEDARDFDDAVWAEPDPDAGNPGGWHIVVAIADVAWYVRPGDALDRAAHLRGNSVYFPDRVVPMLPEALSNGLCSLRPRENRACLAMHLWIDANGRTRRHRLERGLMRSAARLTYRQVQDAREGRPDEITGPLLEPVIAPLYGAFAALDKARRRRGTLEIELPERKVVLDRSGRPTAILPRERLDSHRLIEEFMIAANVAAAEMLTKSGIGCLYRVHDKPDASKVDALRDFLESIGIRKAAGEMVQPRHFTRLLREVEGGPFATLVNELVLRAQAQAVYSPDNNGHFGLALRHYAHFTSPIRRYADLLVHRALVAAFRLGEGGLPAGGAGTFAEAGQHLSMAERRAAAAERDTVDRFAACYLAARVGTSFAGRIGGVTRFGLFVRLADVGVDGFIPISTLPADYYDHDENRHALIGRRSGRTFTLGETVEVRLAATDPVTGSILLNLLDGGAARRRAMAPRRRTARRGS